MEVGGGRLWAGGNRLAVRMWAWTYTYAVEVHYWQ